MRKNPKNIVFRVGRTKILKKVGKVTVPDIPYEFWEKNDHVTIYHYNNGGCSWAENGYSGQQVDTGGGKKDRFTV